MVDFRSILPDSSTAYERALEIALLPHSKYDQAINNLRGIIISPPDELLIWLAWEYGLFPIVPYLPNLRVAIEEGLKWQKERGTELGIRRALSWVNIDLEVFEEEVPGVHWRELQYDVGYEPSPDEIKLIEKLTKLSSRAVTKLTRLYHGYDIRRFVLDDSQWGDLLDNYSGRFINGLWLSFGEIHQHVDHLPCPTALSNYTYHSYIDHCIYPDRLPLGGARIFGEIPEMQPRFVLFTVNSTEAFLNPECLGVTTQSISKCQLTLSESLIDFTHMGLCVKTHSGVKDITLGSVPVDNVVINGIEYESFITTHPILIYGTRALVGVSNASVTVSSAQINPDRSLSNDFVFGEIESTTPRLSPFPPIYGELIIDYSPVISSISRYEKNAGFIYLSETRLSEAALH